jgi:uncharacterized protein YjbJ (UPF0337 family)
MRSIAILAACAAITVGVAPMIAQAQTATTTTTTTSTTVSPEVKTMWEKMKGSWKQTKGAVKEQWGKLTDDDLMQVEGRREILVGKIQTRYGISHEQAEAQVSGWEVKHKDM